MENKILKRLMMGGDNICNHGAITILEGMKHNSTLISLGIFWCGLSFAQKGTNYPFGSHIYIHIVLFCADVYVKYNVYCNIKLGI